MHLDVRVEFRRRRGGGALLTKALVETPTFQVYLGQPGIRSV
jgi:hypothetical protein